MPRRTIVCTLLLAGACTFNSFGLGEDRGSETATDDTGQSPEEMPDASGPRPPCHEPPFADQFQTAHVNIDHRSVTISGINAAGKSIGRIALTQHAPTIRLLTGKFIDGGRFSLWIEGGETKLSLEYLERAEVAARASRLAIILAISGISPRGIKVLGTVASCVENAAGCAEAMDAAACDCIAEADC